MPGRPEEQFMDVLQNIESALVSVYKAHADMTDYDAQAAVNALARAYHAEARKSAPPAIKLSPLTQEAYDSVRAMCEWRLGRTRATGLFGRLRGLGVEPLTLEDMIDCLKRIRRSIERWNKEGGWRGYYEFVKEYVK